MEQKSVEIKEKQIEEMAKDLQKSEHWRFNEHSIDFEIDRKKTAENLYNAGYRKQSEGEWQIKSEIYKMIDDVDEEIFVECSVCHRRFYVPYELDDEKIFKYARENYPYCNCGAKMKGGE